MRRFMAAATCLYFLLNPANTPAWDAGTTACKHKECSAGELQTKDGKWRGNTHLWVVNRGIDLLAKSNDPIAMKVVARMNKPACRDQWESGLWDADDGYLAEGYGANQWWGTHFYNPTRRDAYGNPTDIRTWVIQGNFWDGQGYVQFGDGRMNARYRLRGMLRRPGDPVPETNLNLMKLSPGQPFYELPITEQQLFDTVFTAYYPGSFIDDTPAGDSRCYDLGLALHYLTDTTQPMHSSGFDVTKIPLMLHAVFEEYVPTVQARFPVNQDWDKKRDLPNTSSGPPSADQVFDWVGWRSNALAPPLMAALNGSGGTCSYNPENPILYTGACFRGNAKVDERIGVTLRTAYVSAASYLWAAFNDEYNRSQLGKSCPAGTQLASNDMCYQECRPGYETYGLTCVEKCPKGDCNDYYGSPEPEIYNRLGTKAKS